MKITVYMAISLDGFIADVNGGVDWLNRLSEAGAGSSEDYGYAALMSAVDVLVMGRNTFEQVLHFESWPYGSLPVTVLTHHPLNPILPGGALVSTAVGSPQELIKSWQKQGVQHVYLDGGQVVTQFLKADLIDEIVLTQVPAILGLGIPLFHQALDQEHWVIESTTAYANGFVQRVLKTKRARTSPDSK